MTKEDLVHNALKKCTYIYEVADVYKEIDDELKILTQDLFIKRVKFILVCVTQKSIILEKQHKRFFDEIIADNILYYEYYGYREVIKCLYTFSNFISREEIITTIERLLKRYNIIQSCTKRDILPIIKDVIKMIDDYFGDLYVNEFNLYRMMIALTE